MVQCVTISKYSTCINVAEQIRCWWATNRCWTAVSVSQVIHRSLNIAWTGLECRLPMFSVSTC